VTPTTPTAPPTAPAQTAKPKTPGALAALFRLVLRQQLSRGRFILFAVMVAFSSLLGWLISQDFAPRDSAINVTSDFGLSLVVPITALILGTAALGNWVDDQTLVYVWLKPVSRWKVAVAATLAASLVAVAVTVPASLALGALAVGGDTELLLVAAGATALATLAYTSLFVALGLLVRRALLWGLVYVFIWELFVSRAGAGAARFAVNSYARSILANSLDAGLALAEWNVTTSYITLSGVFVAGVAFTWWRLVNANVD
jgi:ABC-2 type transport system permease protein